MTNRPTKEERDTKPPMIFTVSDASTACPAPSPSTSTSSGAAEEEVVWKTMPLKPPEDPIDLYYRRYATVQPSNQHSLYEKNPERGRLPHYLTMRPQMHRQTSEAPSESPSKREARRRSRTPAKRSRFLRSIYYVGSRHELYGLRHIILVLILVAAWLLGSLMFWVIEAPAEKVAVADTYAQLGQAFDTIGADLQILSRTKNATEMAAHVKNAYIKLLEIEGKYRWSAIHKTETTPEGTWTWTFGSAFFFTMTLFTTVGYGSIAPGTDAGRVAVIIYSCFWYPFLLVVVRDLGQLLLIIMTRIYGKILIRVRLVRGYLVSDNDTISLPISISIIVTTIFIALAAVFFHYYDMFTGPLEGLNSFHAFYFSYLSYTAIGFGDVNPVNEPYSMIVAIVVIAGLPLMRVVTKGIIVAMENGYHGIMLFVESKLEGRVYSSEETKTEKQPVGEAAEVVSCYSSDEEDDEEKKAREELMQNFTIRSLAKFMTSNRDIYNGEFGKVEFRKSDL